MRSGPANARAVARRTIVLELYVTFPDRSDRDPIGLRDKTVFEVFIHTDEMGQLETKETAVQNRQRPHGLPGAPRIRTWEWRKSKSPRPPSSELARGTAWRRMPTPNPFIFYLQLQRNTRPGFRIGLAGGGPNNP